MVLGCSMLAGTVAVEWVTGNVYRVLRLTWWVTGNVYRVLRLT